MVDRVLLRVPIYSARNTPDFFEGIWARKLSTNQYQIDNIPFYAYGLNNNDIVEVEPSDNTVMRVLKHNGHSTYRIRLSTGKNFSDFQTVWPELDKLGCSFEGTTKEEALFSIDVPERQNVRAVYNILQHYESEGLWEFEEGHYSNS
jgi:hypothetical protein